MSHHVQWLYFLDPDTGPCEIINGERTLAALNTNATSCGLVTGGHDCQWDDGTVSLALDPCSLDDDGEQTWAPLTFDTPTWPGNPAPWWDGVPGSPSSTAYGFWIEEWTGLDGAHHKRNVSPRAGRRGGANFGSLSSGHRVWKMNIIMVGGSAASLEDLFRWFESTLLDCCNPCSGSEMLIRTTCPPDDDPGWGLYRVKGAALLEGPTWEEMPMDNRGCELRRISVTLGVSDPCLYSCSTNCTVNDSFPGIDDCVPIGLFLGCGVTCTDMEPYRICCPVPAATRGTVSPVVTIENNGPTDSAPIRIYGMTDPLNVGCDPCSLPVCQDIVTRAIPPGGTLLIDSSTRKVLYRDSSTNQIYVDGTSFIAPPEGTVPSYLTLSCDPGWVAIEPAAFCGNTDDLLISVDIVQRVGCC